MQNPPQNIHHLIESLDLLMSEYPRGYRYVPLLLRGADEPGHAVAVEAVKGYRGRLRRPLRNGAPVPIVPHALLDEAVLSSLAADGAGPPDEGGVPRLEPCLALLERIADRLQGSMPKGSGTLHLPSFHTCLHVMGTRASVDGNALPVRRKVLERELYEYLKKKNRLVEFTDKAFTVLGDFKVLGFLRPFLESLTPTRRVYGWWLRHRAMRWVGGLVSQLDRDFLTEAVEFSLDGPERSNGVLMERILLTALLRDLGRASRITTLGAYRRRGRWPFVLLFTETAGPDELLRGFLRAYSEVAGKESPAPLLMLGALAGELPDGLEVETLRLDPEGRIELTDRTHGLFGAGGRGGKKAPPMTADLAVVPLPTGPDNGDAERWLRYHPYIPGPLRPRYVRIIAFLLVPIFVAVFIPIAFPEIFDELPCEETKTGERIGIAADADGCAFAKKDTELHRLLQLVGRENKAVGRENPYRTVVFAAPLTRADGKAEQGSNALLALRGAIMAQRETNNAQRHHQMPIRLLVANTGQYFRYGVATLGGDPALDVAKMITERVEKDRLVAVVGITQSRKESLDAVRRFDKVGLLTLGIGVTGSRMVDDSAPPRYFQLSAPNARIADVMASFAENSAQIEDLASAEKGRRSRHAVVVYHPGDDFFSEDLREKLEARIINAGGKPTIVRFAEKPTSLSTSTVARRICEPIQKQGGVVLYVGRSSPLIDLFSAIQETAACRREKEIPMIVEALTGEYLENPQKLKGYSFLKVFDVAFNDPSGETASRYRHFADGYEKIFQAPPNPESAGGYDALSLLSKAVNELLATHETDFGASDVYTWISVGGVHEYLGATGVITLGREHRYPPNKAVYVVDSLTERGDRDVQLACGVMPDQKPAKTWGLPGRESDCPSWED